MLNVVVTGIGGSVGSRVRARMRDLPEIDTLQGIDLFEPSPGEAEDVEVHVGDLRSMDLAPVLDKADVLVHLASAFGPSRDYTDVGPLDTAATEAVLKAASTSRIRRLVVLSSAMVYGAWPNNPLPLTEQAPLRPNPGFGFAAHKQQIETLADAWRRDMAAEAVTVLRPTTAVAAGDSSWVARTMRVSSGLAADNTPPLQFLHLDDLADAVVLAVTARLDGAFNVAPDGWASGEEIRQLMGRAPRLRLSSRLAGTIAEAGWRHRLAPTPPGIVPYASHPWVVANDRLRAEGWSPQYSNVEAYVEGHEARPWAMMNSKRRQQLALGATGTAVAVGLGAAGVAARRLRRP